MAVSDAAGGRPRLSVLIKALNEADKIERCLASIREATREFDTEVILVDSNSEDDTVARALRFPEVTVVQFVNVADRGCGAAVQLGYQHAHGDWLYVLDGDMEMAPDFLPQAFAALQADPRLAGVAGVLLDRQVRTKSDERRSNVASSLTEPVLVDELGGGGLYRTSAIREAKYLAHRGLRAYEEAELGMRLRGCGYRLLRIPAIAIWHEGHREGNLQMLLRLWRNGRAAAAGALLREAVTTNWFRLAIRKFKYLFVLAAFDTLALLAIVVVGIAGGVFSAGLFALGVWLFLALALVSWKRSWSGGLWALLFWHHALLAAIGGAVSGVEQRPDELIASTVLRRGVRCIV